MHVVACAEPSGLLEPAPITSLPFHMDAGCEVAAFWHGDEYLMRVARAAGETHWFRILADLAVPDAPDHALTADWSGVLPIGSGRVAFPVGSTGRTYYRVSRGQAGSGGGRTRILGVRAGRSLRQPA